MKPFRKYFASFLNDKDLSILLRGSGLSILFRIVGALGVYAFILILSKLYGPEGNGIFSFVFTMAVILSFACNVGLNTYIVRILPEFEVQNRPDLMHWFLKRSMFVVGGVSLTVSLFLFVISLCVESHLLGIIPKEWLMLSGLQFAFSLTTLLSAAFKARHQVLLFSLLQTNVIQTLAIPVLLLIENYHSSIINPLWACIVVSIINFIGGYLYWSFHHKQESPLKSPLDFGRHLKKARPMLWAGIMFFVMSWSDKIMIRLMYSVEGLGIFEVSHKLASFSNLGLLAILTVAEPRYANLFASNQHKALKNFAHKTTWLSILFNTPAVLIVLCLGPFLLQLFGHANEYTPGLPALFILGSAQLITGCSGPVLNLLSMTNHQDIVAKIVMYTACLNIGLNALLIPPFGITGAAVATLVGTFVWNGTSLFLIKRKLGFHMLTSPSDVLFLNTKKK